MRLSVIRSNAMQSAFNDIMSEFPKCIDIQGVPHDFRAEYEENVRDLHQAFQKKFSTEMISNLGVLEQQHRSEVDSMYATATYALAGELAAAESQRRLVAPPRPRSPPVASHRPRSPTRFVNGLQETTSISSWRFLSESESDENECEEADLEAAKADADDPAGETAVKPE